VATTALPQARPYGRSWSTWIYSWVTTTDHKKIGAMYIATSFAMFMIGGVFALGIRTELAQPGLQFLTPDVYNSLFSLHAITMIFLFVMPMTTGWRTSSSRCRSAPLTWPSRASMRWASGSSRRARS